MFQNSRLAKPVMLTELQFCAGQWHFELARSKRSLMGKTGVQEMPLTRFAVLGLVAAMSAAAYAGDELQMPPEVTPALRAACEQDVRRLCMGGDIQTVAKVKSCVKAKFSQLGKVCQLQIALAGLRP